MLIECKIKFLKDGLTITQNVVPDADASEAADEPLVTGNSLEDTFENSQAAHAATAGPGGGGGGGGGSTGGGSTGKGPGNKPGGGGGGPGGFATAPITVIGPIFLGWPPCIEKKENQKD